jgi:hypothetical protein
MNEPTQTTPAIKPGKKKRTKTVRAPRNIDAGIAAIHAEAKAKVSAYRREKSGERILRVIVEKRLDKLTYAQKQILFDMLAKIFTPALPS